MPHAHSKMYNPTTTTRWTAPEPTGFDKMFQDIWDKRRDTQVKTFMRYETKLACLNFAHTLKRAADTFVALPEADKETKIVSVFGSYLLLDDDADYDKSEAYISKFLRQLQDNNTDFINKYLYDRRIVIVARGRYTTGCLEFQDGSLGVVSPTTGFQVEKKIKELHPIETFYCHLKMLTPEQFEKFNADD